MNNARKIALIGGGGHARSVMAALPSGYDVSGYVDFQASGEMTLPWLGDDDTFLKNESPENYDVLFTVISGRECSLKFRRKLIERYSAFNSPVVTAPTAWVADDARLGRGTVVMHAAVVNTNSSIGPHCVVNTGAIVEHDCKIGSNVFIGPGVVICGGVEVGDDVYIGAGAVVRPGIKICSGTLVSLGASVFRRINVPGTYFGNPARKIK